MRSARLVLLSSLGLVFGCGDDTSTSSLSASGGTTPSTTTPSSSSTDATGSTAAPTSSSGPSTEGTGNASATGSTGDPTAATTGTSMTSDGTASTGMVTASTGVSSDGSTSGGGSTGVMTSDGSTSGGGSTTGDGSTSTTMPNMTTMGGSTTMEMPCDNLKVTLKPIVPNVMLVLDKSGSMISNTWDHDANPNTPAVTRWFSLWAVVDKILTNFNAKFNFGMNLCPSKSAQANYNATACPVSGNVEVPVSPLNKDAIIAALPAQNNNTIKGGTPAAAGVTSALNHIKSLDPTVPRALMLITDGAANCTTGAPVPDLFEKYDQSVHTIVGNAWTNDKIPTYVIGIATANMISPVVQDGNPDSINPYTKLNELAVSGGKPKNDPNEKFYNANNQIELDAALNAIVIDAQSCVIPLEVEPGFPQFTKVKVNGAYVPKINNCMNENGWKYVDPAPPYAKIELCGTACAQLKMVGAVDVEYYCQPG